MLQYTRNRAHIIIALAPRSTMLIKCNAPRGKLRSKRDYRPLASVDQVQAGQCPFVTRYLFRTWKCYIFRSSYVFSLFWSNALHQIYDDSVMVLSCIRHEPHLSVSRIYFHVGDSSLVRSDSLPGFYCLSFHAFSPSTYAPGRVRASGWMLLCACVRACVHVTAMSWLLAETNSGTVVVDYACTSLISGYDHRPALSTCICTCTYPCATSFCHYFESF